MAEYAPASLEYLKAHYKTAEAGNFDIYVCFVEKGLSLLGPNGLFGYILPHKFFQAGYGRALRTLLSEGQHLREIVHFGHVQVFPKSAPTPACFFSRKPPLITSPFAKCLTSTHGARVVLPGVPCCRPTP